MTLMKQINFKYNKIDLTAIFLYNDFLEFVKEREKLLFANYIVCSLEGYTYTCIEYLASYIVMP